MLERLPRERWPTFALGDCGSGSEKVLLEFEGRALPYLCKLRHSPKVKELVRELMSQSDGWKRGGGWLGGSGGHDQAVRLEPAEAGDAGARSSSSRASGQAGRRRDPHGLRGPEGQQLAEEPQSAP